jgi:hypothetical protein
MNRPCIVKTSEVARYGLVRSAAPGLPDSSDSLLSASSALTVGDGHRCAIGRKPLGDRSADASRSACYQRRFIS